MEIGLLAILVINALAGLLGFAALRIAPALPRSAFVGFYLVLMPLGFTVWEDPSFWVQALVIVVGLGWIAASVARGGTESAGATGR